MVKKKSVLTKTTYEKIQQTREEASEGIESIRQDYQAEANFYKKNKPLEESLYTEFVRCNSGKKFIDLEHIDALGIDYNILIVTSIKNTGKNVGIIYKLFNQHYKKNEKVLFLRTSQKEIKESIPEYNHTEANPFIFKPKKGVVLAFHKESGEEVGQFKDFKFCNSGSGGEYEGYGAIIYDECLSWDPRNTLNKGHYLNWAALISSITRNKKEGIKVYCLGNLTGLNTGLLDFYGISRDDNLRYIKRADPLNPDNVCKILYINANNIYQGIKAQVGAVQGMSPEFKTQLYSNKGDLNNMGLVNPKEWDEMEPVLSFISLVDSTKNQIIYEIRKIKNNRYSSEPVVYGVRCRIWESYYIIKGPIYTDNKIIKFASKGVIFIKNIEIYYFFLYKLTRSEKLFYYDVTTQNILITRLKSMEINLKNKYI